MFGELLFSFDSLKLGISYKAKNPLHRAIWRRGVFLRYYFRITAFSGICLNRNLRYLCR